MRSETVAWRKAIGRRKQMQGSCSVRLRRTRFRENGGKSE